MQQKTLNKMWKFCKRYKWRFGQLVVNLSRMAGKGDDVFFFEDAALVKEFNNLWNQDKPKKKTGGYYPKGHTNVSVVGSRPVPIPAALTRAAKTAATKDSVAKDKASK